VQFSRRFPGMANRTLEAEKGQLKHIYPDHSFIFCRYWGKSL
jgi:hypothetical protein